MSTSPRSEYYQAVYDTGHAERSPMSYETVAAASFALCLCVFLGALIYALRRAPERLAQEAMIPLDRPSTRKERP